MISNGSPAARIYLLCGKTGSGKTTYALQLEQQGAVRFSLDEWMIRLYGHEMTREEFDQRVQICEGICFDLVETLASRGLDVVIDHGFWRRAARDRARRRLAHLGIPVELLYFQVPERLLRERLRARNASLPAGTYLITEEMFDTFSAWFEPPDDSEGAILIDSTPA
jgi:predicted kinase